MKKKEYSAPQLVHVEFKTEQGFAGSGDIPVDAFVTEDVNQAQDDNGDYIHYSI